MKWSLPIIMEWSPPIGIVMKRSPEAVSGAAEAGATATATIRATIVINNRMRFFMRYLLIRKGGLISPPIHCTTNLSVKAYNSGCNFRLV